MVSDFYFKTVPVSIATRLLHGPVHCTVDVPALLGYPWAPRSWTNWRNPMEEIQSFGDGREATQKLMGLIFAALDQGIDTVRKGGPLIPFMMSFAADQRETQEFAAEFLEEGVEQAKQAAAALGAEVEAYAIAFDGIVKFKGEDKPAIIVEGAERGREYSIVIAQRYLPPSEDEKFQPFGNPIFLGTGEQLMK
jgi:hypothetical protein